MEDLLVEVEDLRFLGAVEVVPKADPEVQVPAEVVGHRQHSRPL